MVVEQSVLGSVKVLGILFNICDTLYEGWKLTKAFGTDFSKAQHLLQAQHVILCEIRARPLDQLAIFIGSADSENGRVEAIQGILAEIQTTYTKCDELMKEVSRGMLFRFNFCIEMLTDTQLPRSYRSDALTLVKVSRLRTTIAIP